MRFRTETETDAQTGRSPHVGQERAEPHDPPGWFAPLPGAAACLLGTLVAAWLSGLLPVIPMMPLAILLGAFLANAIRLPEVIEPGIAFCARHVLRIGIVLLGLQIPLSEVLGLGWQPLLAVLAVVAGGMASTVWLGRRLGVDEQLTLLIAAGFSVCGAAAVAGAQTVVRASREKMATALALVILFGTLAIGLVPVLGALFGLSSAATGAWAGATIHEVAQVVAAAGVVGGPESTAMQYAVVVKLSRVVLLAAVVAYLAVHLRRRGLATVAHAPDRAPLVPGFVVGFLAMVVLASTGAVPAPVLDIPSRLQSVLLAMAMFALGCGVKFSELRTIGWRPFVLGALASTVVAAIGLLGVLVAF
ncbi:YeiH family protein [Corynebacterium guangdongense]|uniref:Integral membrane protein (TIGR00698 family) n=1 Tax=Corynebacterium guangdongense TaxID=1783348 RepID=A0ABU2A016_9CORY|nr:putative sulfate exporter family transporter [Corynebacterium guangdongense]MDR7330527.1 putative integral membrane protein (TIGR00698 family) [Corynebacterium guangdongense]WJZ19082.1 hypothetical protein CGUA_12775 [Corynebacterium guangdongense]